MTRGKRSLRKGTHRTAHLRFRRAEAKISFRNIARALMLLTKYKSMYPSGEDGA